MTKMPKPTTRKAKGYWVKRYLEYGRPWTAVDKFYANAVRHKKTDPILRLVPEELRARLYRTEDADASTSCSNLSEDGLKPKPKHKSNKQRNTWKVKVGYYGSPLRGYAWQKEEPEKTVEGLLEQALSSLIDKPVISCAGRTDKGVHAVGQVCSFYSWKNLDEQDLLQAIQNENPNVVAYEIHKVPRSFHPMFSCHWRHYMYILPKRSTTRTTGSPSPSPPLTCEENESPVVEDGNLRVEHLRRLLKALEGEERPYGCFSRDTKDKKSLDCLLYFCDVSEATISVEGEKVGVYVINIVGNRFLKRMVRILVSTLVQEAVVLSNQIEKEEDEDKEGDDEDDKKLVRHRYRKMIEIAESGDKLLTQTAAPAGGLCMVGVGYRPY